METKEINIGSLFAFKMDGMQDDMVNWHEDTAFPEEYIPIGETECRVRRPEAKGYDDAEIKVYAPRPQVFLSLWKGRTLLPWARYVLAWTLDTDDSHHICLTIAYEVREKNLLGESAWLPTLSWTGDMLQAAPLSGLAAMACQYFGTPILFGKKKVQ